MDKPLTSVELSPAAPPATKRQKLIGFQYHPERFALSALSLHQPGIPRHRRVEVSLASWFTVRTRSAG